MGRASWTLYEETDPGTNYFEGDYLLPSNVLYGLTLHEAQENVEIGALFQLQQVYLRVLSWALYYDVARIPLSEGTKLVYSMPMM